MRFFSLTAVLGIALVFSVQSPAAAIPNNIFGIYGLSHDVVRVTRGNAGRIRVVLRLYFSHGHTCSLDREGDWQSDHVLIVADGLDPNQACRLQVFFSNGKITLKDEGQRCAPVYCGTRGKLDATELRRRRK
jgi:hypothetical protein